MTMMVNYLFFVGIAKKLNRLEVDGSFESFFGIFGPPFATAPPDAAERYQQDYQGHYCER